MRRAWPAGRAPVKALVAFLLVACGSGDAPDGRPSYPAFDADSAYGLLVRQVEFGPRVPGSEGHAAQLAWMSSYLQARADTVWQQPFRHETGDGRVLALTNVVAQFRPGIGERILLGTHWDTRPMADREDDPELVDQPIPGANDGGSGVAVLLHLADVLSRHSPPIGVDLIFFDGEDWAPGETHLGSKHFALHMPPGYRALYGVVVNMVADTSPEFPAESYSQQYAPEVVIRVWQLAEELGYGSYFPRRSGLAVDGPHVPLSQAGVRTIDIIDFDYGPDNAYWHTHDDMPENVSAEGLGVVGNMLSALLAGGG